MSKAGIPDELREFITENITSIGQLEVLLFLYRNRDRAWTAEDIGAEMRSSHIAATQQLRELHNRHLVSRGPERDTTSDETYTISNEQEGMIRLLSEYYIDYKVSIITLIYEKPVMALRSFADAFRIKKGK